jgi:hypothetical protein
MQLLTSNYDHNKPSSRQMITPGKGCGFSFEQVTNAEALNHVTSDSHVAQHTQHRMEVQEYGCGPHAHVCCVVHTPPSCGNRSMTAILASVPAVVRVFGISSSCVTLRLQGPYCSYATRDGVHVMMSGEVAEWPGGVDAVRGGV